MDSSAAELDTAPKAGFEMAEKVESFLCKSVLWHNGHAEAGEAPRTSDSNSFPQDRHLNSKMGMIVTL